MLHEAPKATGMPRSSHTRTPRRYKHTYIHTYTVKSMTCQGIAVLEHPDDINIHTYINKPLTCRRIAVLAHPDSRATTARRHGTPDSCSL